MPLMSQESIFIESPAKNAPYRGRTGLGVCGSWSYGYDANGNVTLDESRGITDIAYNHANQATDIWLSDGWRVVTSYGPDGTKLRSALASPEGWGVTVRKYLGNLVIEDDRVVQQLFPDGYFDGEGKAYYYLTDYQGNVTGVIDSGAKMVQETGYYPYGEPWLEPEGDNPYLYGGKERVALGGVRYSDFGPRLLSTASGYWGSPDPLCEDYRDLSPYINCAANPVRNIDPTGCVIQGVTKKDASMVVEDFRAMFPGEIFANFRNLIVQSGKKQDGKSLAPISTEELSAAFSGITLNEDQKALVEMVANTINSDDVHKVEYIKGSGTLSNQATKAFLPGFLSGEIGPNMPLIIERNGGLPVWLIVNEGGGGVTTPTQNGSHSLIVLGGEHPNGRAVTTGHEVIGHGRSWATGLGDSHQHVQAIRTENLILRVMGISFINTGINHGTGKIPVPNPSLLPSFR